MKKAQQAVSIVITKGFRVGHFGAPYYTKTASIFDKLIITPKQLNQLQIFSINLLRNTSFSHPIHKNCPFRG